MYRVALFVAAAVFTLCFSGSADAKVIAAVDLSSQTMRVYVNGEHLYTWPVSTARSGYRTPTGSYGVQSMSRFHRSAKYHNAPMPHSIFFRGGYAVHGSYETSHLGQRASHGCIRLHPANARELYSLVQDYGGNGASIVIRP
jgi:lipoprotein-anchoring transpeptidase ErfK/SrfK